MAENAAEGERRPLYEASTQYKHWRFSGEQLAKLRRELNEAAVTSLKQLLEEEEVRSGVCDWI